MIQDKRDHLMELACVELMNHLLMVWVYHTYINPERGVPKEAETAHDLNYAFLKDYLLFRNVAKVFLDFIMNSTLVMHNTKLKSLQ
jgi:DNA polymerase III subunit epsilon